MASENKVAIKPCNYC